MSRRNGNAKLSPGTRVAWSLDRSQAEQFASSPANRKVIGEMVVREEKPPKGAPPSVKQIYAIRVR
jgi:hypothetical protein